MWRGNRYVKPTSESEQALGERMGRLWFVLFATVGLASVVLFDALVALHTGISPIVCVSRLLCGSLRCALCTAKEVFRYAAVVLGLRKRRSQPRELEPLSMPQHILALLPSLPLFHRVRGLFCLFCRSGLRCGGWSSGHYHYRLSPN